MYYLQLLRKNPRMLHVPLDVQVLILIAWGGDFARRGKHTINICCAKAVHEP